ncbi:SxtJ family membrane protein [Thalassospira povalilytica]|uniref:SxtJ family membrane protein n=1 Tax=Thalassospira povalilytica TaxID=732237 RepID=UPI001D188967|nr:SxtJ family membrane protein [Thalassospira povalilytica]MCC4241327.1 SxtJ family membrane protein [Thalassospira povalilytica]
MLEKKSDTTKPQGPSNKSFGFVVGGIFLLIELYRWFMSGVLDTAGIILLVISVPLIVCALLCPKVLTPFNRAWMKLGEIMHHIVNPVVMLLLYTFAICTTGLIMRMLGKDPLRLKLDRDAKSYWIKRDPTGPSPDTMKNQF